MQYNYISSGPFKSILVVIAGIMLLALGIWLGKSYKSPVVKKADEFPSATILEVPVPLLQFSLSDHNGNLFTPDNLMRKWTFIFFGYTHCPDVCPTALVDMNNIYHNLAGTNELIEKTFGVGTQFLFITVDPERDTVSELKDYVPFFNEHFIGLTGEADMIDSIARPLGIAYRRVPGKYAAKDYLVDHSASILLIDPLGRMRAVFSPPHVPKMIAEDFRNIRGKYTEECCISGDEKTETVIFDYRKEKK
ncbi:MAG: SCO family protein [Nitrospiraceae bacterium]|nr:MAG: SCO family protein [Nitrospiraceae bacterium]